MFDANRKYTEQALRVTYYGRVSTESDIQLGSLSHQQQYFEEKIKTNQSWIYVPGYVDEGISGTSIEHRTQFKRMVTDAKAGKFDMIVTKEVSRFARDIIDTVQTCRDLLSYRVIVLFEDMQLCTAEPDAEFRLSIMATVAQEESRKISERIRFGYQQTFKNGKRHGAAAPIGYNFNNENNGYSINQETAPIVKYVFSTYANGEYGLHSIAKQLAEMGYLNTNGNPYSDVVIRRMINNPTYMGYIVNGRSKKESYRSNKIILTDQSNWHYCYCPDRVPPLVGKDVWEKANQTAICRHKQYSGVNTLNKDIFGNGKYAYSGKIICGNDGSRYSHTIGKWFTSDGNERKIDCWRCSTYIKRGVKACDSPALYTNDLNDLFITILEKYNESMLNAGKNLAKLIETVFKEEDAANNTEELNSKQQQLEHHKDQLMDGWLRGIIKDHDCKRKIALINEEIDVLSKRISTLSKQEEKRAKREQLAEIIDEVFKTADINNNSTIEEIVRILVNKILVCKENGQYKLDIYLADAPVHDTYNASLSIPLPKQVFTSQIRVKKIIR